MGGARDCASRLPARGRPLKPPQPAQTARKWQVTRNPRIPAGAESRQRPKMPKSRREGLNDTRAAGADRSFLKAPLKGPRIEETQPPLGAAANQHSPAIIRERKRGCADTIPGATGRYTSAPAPTRELAGSPPR